MDWDRLPVASPAGQRSKVRSVKVGGALVAWDGRGRGCLCPLPCGTSRWPKGFAQLLTAQGWGARELKPLANGTTAGPPARTPTHTAVGVTPTSEVVTLRGPGSCRPQPCQLMNGWETPSPTHGQPGLTGISCLQWRRMAAPGAKLAGDERFVLVWVAAVAAASGGAALAVAGVADGSGVSARLMLPVRDVEVVRAPDGAILVARLPKGEG